jgi:signal transduction histidine kinase
MADSLALTSAHMRKDGIGLVVDVPDHLPSVIGHHQQIQQVFLNIINNAHYALNQKYPKGNDNKSLTISAEIVSAKGRDFVRVVFLDKGTGIPLDIMDKVMNPFFSTKPEDKGTGLGLSISHGIITDHGGRLSIESREGEYTKITIELPAEGKK